MKSHLALPLLAVLLATPAFAQSTTDGPYPNRNTPGSGSELRDDNVWRGAIESQEPSQVIPYEAEPNLGAPGLETGRSAVEGPPPVEPDISGFDSGMDRDEDLPPNRALPGSDAEQRDENVWFGD